MKNRLFIRFLLSLSLLVLALPVKSQVGSCEEWIAALKARQGRVETQVAKNVFWTTAELEDTYCFGDKLRTFQRSRATVLLHDKSYLRLNQNTITGFPEYKGKEKFSIINLIKGAVFFRSRVPRRLEVETPFVNAVIKGTEFLVVVKEDETQVTVFEGVVETTNKHGQLTLNKGETAIAKVNQPPRRHILVKPKNAVQWALYYPPVIDFRIPPSDPAVSNLESAFDAYRRGDLSAAFDVLDRIPEGQRSNTYFTLRSGLLLTVGRVDEAQPDIARVLAENPDDVNAISLKSIIAVAQNDNDEALGLAEKAVNTDPQSAPALIALSYAQQAKFELEAARESLEKAVELAPDDALAWARLAELQLSFGDLDSALEAAEKAVSLNPDLERTQSVLGFAALTQIDIDKAKAAFEKAIRFDPAAPLPRLGLGLAKIRQGDLDEGTEDMEIAASLDPDNSLIRSYLGKAFYEKKDKRWAGKELAMAKELDPKDPTPWFYDAILKQTTNRPVEALHDMQKAIALNDNRAVYRSRLLLDDDLAARSASLGRIYNDLGFQQLGLVEGWKSVNADPSNYSAHRLLADNYAALPRHEIARVSELLQAQLLQPINVTPVQPQLIQNDPTIVGVGGPSILSANEFTPLFLNNGISIVANGVVASNNTWGDDVIVSGIHNAFSASVGQYHIETDGFRNNADLKQDVYTAFVQKSLSNYFSVQAQVSREELENGDVITRSNNHRRIDFQESIKRDTVRMGFHYQLSTSQKIIGSGIYQDNRETETSFNFPQPDSPAFGRKFGKTEISDRRNGYYGELQHLFHHEHLRSIIGIGYIDFHKTTLKNRYLVSVDTGERDLLSQAESRNPITHLNSYIYEYLTAVPNLTAILGVSYDLSNENTVRDQFNPKLGIIWTPMATTTIRLAGFRVFKRPLIANRTLEPTQVAGFNQFFDDIDGAESWRYGMGIDQYFHPKVFGGVEFSWRDVNKSIGTANSSREESRDETFHRAYLYWTPHQTLAVGAQFRFNDTNTEGFVPGNGDSTNAQRIKTYSLPLTANYFASTGFFAKLGATYVDQKTKFVNDNKEGRLLDTFKDAFWVVDASVGYRFPKRYGQISFEITNLFDEDFQFQSEGIDTQTSRSPLYQPDRMFLAHINFSF